MQALKKKPVDPRRIGARCAVFVPAVRAALGLIVPVVLGGALLPASAHAAFPGRDGRIAFERSGKGDTSHVFTVHPNGKGVSRMPCSTPNRPCADGDPAWSRPRPC